MLRTPNSKQSEMELVVLEDLVPENHFLRKIDKYIDFSFVREKLSPFYCKDNGRPAIDPVMLFKIFLLGYFYGIRSERQLMRDIQVNLAYRWFLGLNITDSIPDHSTLSQNRNRRFQNSNIFQEIFDEIVFLAISKKLVKGEVLYTDSTHLKANANKKKFDRKDVEGTAKGYLQELEDDINKDRVKHGRKKLKEKPDTPKTKNIKVSKTDPDSGYLYRDNKEESFAYLDHRTVDSKYNIITDVHVTKGNIHDSIPYIDRLDYQIDKFGFNVIAVGLDAGYNTAALSHGLVKRDIFGAIAYKAPGSSKEHIRKKYFKYDSNNDVYICPANQILAYSTTGRDGYKVYQSNPKICAECKLLKKCTSNKDKRRTIARHVWEEDKIKIDSNRLTDYGKKIYKRRKETVERSFADAKQLHGYRYAKFRGLERVTFQCLMTAICQNMKKIATLLDKRNNRKIANVQVISIFSLIITFIMPEKRYKCQF